MEFDPKSIPVPESPKKAAANPETEQAAKCESSGKVSKKSGRGVTSGASQVENRTKEARKRSRSTQNENSTCHSVSGAEKRRHGARDPLNAVTNTTHIINPNKLLTKANKSFPVEFAANVASELNVYDDLDLDYSASPLFDGLSRSLNASSSLGDMANKQRKSAQQQQQQHSIGRRKSLHSSPASAIATSVRKLITDTRVDTFKLPARKRARLI